MVTRIETRYISPLKNLRGPYPGLPCVTETPADATTAVKTPLASTTTISKLRLSKLGMKPLHIPHRYRCEHAGEDNAKQHIAASSVAVPNTINALADPTTQLPFSLYPNLTAHRTTTTSGGILRGLMNHLTSR
jgi:hypothetical protein